MSEKFLGEFCVITTSGSAYAVKFPKNGEDKHVRLVKWGEMGKVLCPQKEFEDDMLAVGQCLMLFPEQKENCRIIPSAALGSYISGPIAVLFLSEIETIKCFHRGEFKKFNSLWEKYTAEVLDAIGSNHPYCIALDGFFGLLP